MKDCPKCGTRYTDDTLVYCLQDGVPLISPPETETPTVVIGETETVVSRSSGDRFQVPVAETRQQVWQQNQVNDTELAQSPKSGSRTFLAVAATVAVMLVLFAVIGFGVFMFVRNSQSQSPANSNVTANIPGNTVSANSTPTPQISPIAAPTAARTATPVPANANGVRPPLADDVGEADREVTQRLSSWKSQAESLDLNAYMSHYAGTVDYYRRPGASVAFVRADKQRAFARYDSIRIDLSNISVTVDPSGQTATAVFDKEWNFQGAGDSSGKVRQMLRFNKSSGRWLITSERDIKVYYTR